MSNTFLTISMITYEALVVLRNNLVAAAHVNRAYDASFGQAGNKIGATLNIRKPVNYVVNDGPNLVVQDITETSVPLVINQQKEVGMNYTTADLVLNMDAFRDRYIYPAMVQLANRVDLDVLAQYVNAYNTVGTPGTIPTALLTYLTAGVKLNNGAVPNGDNWCLFVTPLMQAYIVDALKTLFQSSSQIAMQYEKGKMGMAAGYTWYMDQNVNTATVGTIASSTPIVTTANQTGTVVNSSGWNSAATTLNQGDIIQFAGVYSVNPKNFQSTGVLQDFTVTATISDTTGAIAIPISPAIIVNGPYQTVNASPAASATITVYGVGSASFSTISGAASPQGMLWHPDGITLAFVDLPLPRGTNQAMRAADPDLGISLRIISDYNIQTDQEPTRVDVLYGIQTIRPEFLCRVAS